ncbi:hypothetical protein ACFYM0_32975 [Streptomyces sp. NPDC006487]|uniref:hypothetical protein n=1 Tax=Streptomyces sp. NPDC006487 TaxID=3364748 RepID=UPI0036B94D5A
MSYARRNHPHPLAAPTVDKRWHSRTTARWHYHGAGVGRAHGYFRVRRLLSMFLAPAFTASGVLFALEGLRGTQDGVPSTALCAVLSAGCLVLAAASIADLDVIRRRLREQWHHRY